MRSDPETMRIVLSALRAHLPAAAAPTRPELAALQRLRGSARALRRGEDLFVQGRRHEGFFVLMEGYALRYRILPDGRRQVLDVCIPGDTIGGPSCFIGAALNTATALTPAAVAFVSPTAIVGVFERFPRLTLALFHSSTAEAARIGEHLIDVGRRGVSERVAHFILELSTRLEVVGLGAPDAFTMPITQVQLADILGLSVPHTNRVLRHLREERLLEVAGSHFHILDRQALADLADFSDSYLGLRGQPSAPAPAPGSPMRSEKDAQGLLRQNGGPISMNGHPV